jgi:hypothetical protein
MGVWFGRPSGSTDCRRSVCAVEVHLAFRPKVFREEASGLGHVIRDKGTRVGFSATSIVGLSYDYVGYILSKDEFLSGGYESCVSFYGYSLGEKNLDAAARVLEELTTH